MKVETKYSCGDKVYCIESRQEAKSITCAFCDGKGRIVGANDESRTCPECYGRPQQEYLPLKYMVGSDMLTVGLVRFECRKSAGLIGEEMWDNYKPQESVIEEYMLVETGIGSGRVWKQGLLFSSKIEAQSECDALNAKPKEAEDEQR